MSNTMRDALAHVADIMRDRVAHIEDDFIEFRFGGESFYLTIEPSPNDA